MIVFRPIARLALFVTSVLCLTAFALPALGAQAAVPCDPATDYATAAMAAYDAAEYEASLPDFFCAVALDPENVDLHYAATIANLRAGRIFSVFRYSNFLDSVAVERYDDMAQAGMNGLVTDPQDEQSAILIAFAHYPILQADLNRILAINPDSPVAALYAASKAAYQDSDGAAAREAANRAVELAPDDPEVLLYASSILANGLGDLDAALALTDRALELEPDSLAGIVARADNLRGQGELEAATAEYARAIAMDPYDLTLLARRARLLQSAGDYAGAITDYANYLAANPGDPFSLSGLVESALASGDSEHLTLAAQSFEAARSEALDGDPLTADAPVTAAMTAGRLVRIPVRLEAGQEVTISARAAEPASLDPLILVVGPNGGALAFNDDVDANAGDYSAVVTFTPDQAGDYTILATHAGAGSEGEMTIRVEQP